MPEVEVLPPPAFRARRWKVYLFLSFTLPYLNTRRILLRAINGCIDRIPSWACWILSSSCSS